MPQTYFAILTAVGEAKDANAHALGVPLVITHMAVGDGNGVLPVPDRTRIALVNEVRRAALNQISIDPLNANQVIAEQVIPENVGGWWIREIGLYDADGDLIAIANCPPTYKPLLAEGSGRTQVIRMVLIFTSADGVQLKIDPAVVLATRKYADDAIVASMAAHVAAADPHPQYLTTSEGDMMIAAAIAALVNASPVTLDTLKELATALGNDANFATTMINTLALKAPLDSPTLTGEPKAPTPEPGDNDTSIATTAFVQAALSLLTTVPPGMYASFPSTTAPAGWVKRNGALLPRASYPALWAFAQASGNMAASDGVWQIGQFSPGDGATTFRIPDGRGEFDRNWDDGRGIDPARALGSAQADEIKSHAHGLGRIANSTDSARARMAAGPEIDSTVKSTDATGGTETRPRNVASLACIKY